jgi:hypothetical protein
VFVVVSALGPYDLERDVQLIENVLHPLLD